MIKHFVNARMHFGFKKTALPGLASIIIPCYNAERFLAETLESAFYQSYPQIEIIVVDDGSTDRTAKIINAYSHRLYAQFGSHCGASAARNRGTVLARGEFIQYLDADDLLTPDAVARRIAALQNTRSDVAYSDWQKLFETEPGIFEACEHIARRIEDVHPVPEIALMTSFWAPPAALTYRRTVVEKIGGWKEWLPILEDTRFLQDAALVGGKFVYVSGVGARYRVHRGASLSRGDHVAFVSALFHNTCDLQAIFEARGGLSTDERHALTRLYGLASRSFFVHDRRTLFRECVARIYNVEAGFRLSWPKVASLASKMFGFKAASVLLPLMSRLQRAVRQR
jgi:glycosyltransferase involved in cell wall biosynthesis